MLKHGYIKHIDIKHIDIKPGYIKLFLGWYAQGAIVFFGLVHSL